MSKLVPPHFSDQVKPLLLPERSVRRNANARKG